MDKEFCFDLVFVIGAPRSGTNMLRDVITSFEECQTWPCDEINYVLRHGNIRFRSDEFPPALAKRSVKKYLRRTFSDFAKKHDAKILVEKTCANSLRVPFLNEVFPEAKFIFIYRDGLDATGSAKLRWTAKLDLRYILEKLRFVPMMDLPYYGLRYFYVRIHRIFSSQKRLAFWGPILSNMQSVLEHHSLNEVCAIQWQQCVDIAEQGLKKIRAGRVQRVSYEAFVNEPEKELGRILRFLGVEATNTDTTKAVQGVTNKNLGKGRCSLGKDEVRNIEKLVGSTLEKYGYL